jgi:hypothetical protein
MLINKKVQTVGKSICVPNAILLHNNMTINLLIQF